MDDKELSAEPPVVVFGFNRAERLRQALAALEPQRPGRLIVVVDGPRDDADRPAVEACRRLARGIDWAHKATVLHESNRGCAGVPGDIDRIFDEHEAAIFVEDDCLPMPGFLDFMRQGLERYRGEPRVFSLCGYQILPRSRFRGYPYRAAGASQFRCWGWATTRDRWQAARRLFPGFGDLFNGLADFPDSEDPGLATLAREAAAGQVDYWDIMLSAICLHQGWINLVPTRGLVRNTGIGGQGAHRVLTPPGIHNRNVGRRPAEPLDWPPADADFSAYRDNLGRYLRRARSYKGRYRAVMRRLGRLRRPFSGR